MQVATRTLTGGSDLPGALPQGVRVLDSWQNERFGGVLFWIDMSLNFHGWGTAILHDAMLRHDRDGWRPMGGGGGAAGTAEELAAEKGPGLHRLSTTSQDPVRLMQAFASPGVCAIELRSVHGRASRSPGLDGFSLIGITHNDPITYAQALDRDGQPIAGEPLLL